MRIVHFLILVITSVCIKVQAQFFIAPHIFYHKEGIKPVGLNSFMDSYNSYYSVGMKDPFDHFGSLPSWGMGYGVDLINWNLGGGGIYFRSGILISHAKTSSSAKIWNNYSNEIILKMNDWRVPFDFGVNIKGVASLFLASDFTFRKTELEMWTIYPDGSRSIGNEFDINGVYTALHPIFNLGVGAAFRVWKLTIPVRLTYGFNLFNEVRVPLTDYDANEYRSNDFPRDFSLWLNSLVGANPENVVYKDEITGMHFSIGIKYLFDVTTEK